MKDHAVDSWIVGRMHKGWEDAMMKLSSCTALLSGFVMAGFTVIIVEDEEAASSDCSNFSSN